MNRAFSSEELVRKAEFLFVRCADLRTARAVKSGKPPEFIVFDCDAERIGSWAMKSPGDLQTAMKESMEKYASKDIAWNEYGDKALAKAKEEKKLTVLFFADDKKESQDVAKMLEDRAVAKHHANLFFIKVTYTPDCAEAKLWGVNQAPTVMIIDPKKEAGSKAVIDRLAGPKHTPLGYKAMIAKGLEKLKAEEKK